jgi:hypothetical protein
MTRRRSTAPQPAVSQRVYPADVTALLALAPTVPEAIHLLVAEHEALAALGYMIREGQLMRLVPVPPAPLAPPIIIDPA